MKHKEEDEPDFSKLQFLRIFTPDHIPRELVEQIKEHHYEPDAFYDYLRLVCVTKGDGVSVNPLCHLYVIADEKKHVVGFLWFEVNLLEKVLMLHTFSMKPDYWHKGKCVKVLADFMKNQLKKLEMKKVYWNTKYPKHSERYGFKRSKNVLMEYDLDIED